MKNILIIIFSFIFMANTCRKKDQECNDNSHNAIYFANNSARHLNYCIYWNFPDTTIGEYRLQYLDVIEPNQSQVRGAGPNSCWEFVLKDEKKEFVYFFDQDSLESLPWDTVRSTNRGLLERREISLQYLQDHNFTISYP